MGLACFIVHTLLLAFIVGGHVFTMGFWVSAVHVVMIYGGRLHGS